MKWSSMPGHQVLKSFYATFAEDIDKNNVDDLTKLFNVFARAGWDNMSVINSFIQGLGEGFDKFSDTELSIFCNALSFYGL